MGPRTDVALNVYLEGGAWNHERALIDANVYADSIADAVGLRVHFATADTPATFQELAGSRSSPEPWMRL